MTQRLAALSIQAEVLDWADSWLTAATGLDPQAVGGLLDQADAHLMTEAGYLGSWQTATDMMTEHFGALAEWDAEWTMRRVDVLGPDAALFVGQTTGRVLLSTGEEYADASGFSFVLRRVDGTWKGLFGQQTGIADPPS